MLLWFRNDLRTHDNPALHYFLSHLQAGNTGKAVFFISEKQWRLHDWAPIKIDFIRRHANALVNQLKGFNVELELVCVDDFAAQVEYLKDYCQKNNISRVIANSELEYNEQQRDKSCVLNDIPLLLFEADVIAPKGKVLNQSGQMFKVFTPFKKAWLKYIREHGFEYLGKVQALSTSAHVESLTSDAKEQVEEQSLSANWPLAHEYEAHVLPRFIGEKISNYHQLRDIPSIRATSGISPYLATGVISSRYILTYLLSCYPDMLIASDSDEFSWLNEIIWREFYRHLMFKHQSLCKHQCFNDKYQNLSWHNDKDYFEAWCQGKTGYPIVDAAMRQLNQTGWMHNRLRMVVASFLTKHLLIDWRLGEKYFMQHLIDGDLASNNGGWQWAASTGCDAQPYFRVFNPIRQSERFDPKGEFIRKYIPELENIPDKEIHFPHQYIEKHKLNIYWPALVEHKSARLNAIEFYK